ncbi:MAG: hypothetical protein D6731_04595 [Planctomycetota bacterium]|nr:MAG: hypothetical protein D6731_04595 [Planctomycetota bacterium]
MNRRHAARSLSLLLVGGAALAFAGCGGGGGGGGSTAPAESAPPPASDPSTWPSLSAAREVKQGKFVTSTACWNCHSTDSAMQDAAGRDISPYRLWQGTLMANAARDPLWRAQISVERAATPALAGAIESKCLHCHAPMGVDDAVANGEVLRMRDLENDSDRGQLALDGVSCSHCHQADPPQDVTSTFNGNYALNDRREIYGPHAAPDAFPMSFTLGYLPTEAAHMTNSNQCASCHTLYTDAVDADGQPTGGQLPEQTPFLEWQNSVFNDQVANPSSDAASCQACHVPTTDEDGNVITSRIVRASQGTQPRSPYGRHVFVGGNTLVPQILKNERDALKAPAPDEAFDEVATRARDQLRRATAEVAIGHVARSGNVLTVPVTVRNLTGHKFPTGHPLRRAWLRTIVRDAQGAVVFSSGDFDRAGRIVGSDGTPLPSERRGGPIQPHRAVIDAPGQVQIYQSLLADAQGELTWLLLRGESYLKDNRLLPRGWDPAHPAARDTAPQGVGGDSDFVGGQDEVVYRVPVSGSGPFQVEVSLYYQVANARYLEELYAYRTPEVDAFRTYAAQVDRRPELVARAVATSN